MQLISRAKGESTGLSKCPTSLSLIKEGTLMTQTSTTKRIKVRKDFQVKIVKLDKESVLRQAEVF